jgi:hypothetical protein
MFTALLIAARIARIQNRVLPPKKGFVLCKKQSIKHANMFNVKKTAFIVNEPRGY